MALSLAEMVKQARAEATEISPGDASRADGNHELGVIVDVREPHEFREQHVPGAINIPRGLLELRADPNTPVTEPRLSRDPSARVLLYCTKGPGARSLLAAQTLASMGYEHVEVLAGGLVAWSEAGLPVESEGEPATA
jgi:rhodanese-related sulfurtransferase